MIPKDIQQLLVDFMIDLDADGQYVAFSEQGDEIAREKTLARIDDDLEFSTVRPAVILRPPITKPDSQIRYLRGQLELHKHELAALRFKHEQLTKDYEELCKKKAWGDWVTFEEGENPLPRLTSGSIYLLFISKGIAMFVTPPLQVFGDKCRNMNTGAEATLQELGDIVGAYLLEDLNGTRCQILAGPEGGREEEISRCGD